MKIILTGGGTGGHIVPNLAVIAELRKIDAQIAYIGEKGGMEELLIRKAGVEFFGIKGGKMRRYFSWRNFSDIFRVFYGFFQARKFLKIWQPQVIFSKGGYVALPVVYAGYFLKIPVVIHESDFKPGLTNKFCAPAAQYVCLSFPETKQFFGTFCKNKLIYTGSPVRENLASGSVERAIKLFNLKRDKKVLLVMGGSQGAKQINDLVRKNLKKILEIFQIIHLVGKGNLDKSFTNPNYKQFEYLDEEMADLYSVTTVAVTRGGANSLFELAAFGKKAIIVPLSKTVSRGDQILNARYFAEKYGWEILEDDFTEEDFLKKLFAVAETVNNENYGKKVAYSFPITKNLNPEINLSNREIVRILKKVAKKNNT